MVEMEHKIPEKIFSPIPKDLNKIPQENLEPPCKRDIAEFFFQILRFAHSVPMLSHFLIIGNGATQALRSPRTALFSQPSQDYFPIFFLTTRLRKWVLFQGLSRRRRTPNHERRVAYAAVLKATLREVSTITDCWLVELALLDSCVSASSEQYLRVYA